METFLSFLLRGLLLFSVAISSTVAAPTSAADAAVTVLAPKQISRSELTQLIKRGGPNGIPPLAEARAAIARGGFSSVPTWAAFYVVDGIEYRADFVGGSAFLGGTTRLDSVLVPIRIVLPYGVPSVPPKPTVFDPTDRIMPLLASPLFQPSTYATGTTQFQDAVQRASFLNIAPGDWHTLLNMPRVLPAIEIRVPARYSVLYQVVETGALIGAIDLNYWIEATDKLAQSLRVDARQLLMFFTENVFLSNGAMAFHGLALIAPPGNIQTFVWASWYTPDTVDAGSADIAAMSHEIAEWMNDPFIGNVTPEWRFPYWPFADPVGCLDLFEVAHVLELLPDPSYPVTLGGMTYHPQNQATASWFAREPAGSTTSLSYSFPDTSLLTTYSQPCPY